MPTDIQSPEIAYGPIVPLLIVFGAAVIGVLIEAFARRTQRRSLQIAVAALGLLGALAANRLLGSLLFEVGPADALTLAAVALLLLVVAALASLLPARSSARIAPAVTLRAD